MSTNLHTSRDDGNRPIESRSPGPGTTGTPVPSPPHRAANDGAPPQRPAGRRSSGGRVVTHAVYLALLMILYVLPYYVMSRSGAAQARAWGMKGYYFVLPVDENGARTHAFLVDFYQPLIWLENVIGTNMPVGGYMMTVPPEPKTTAPVRDTGPE
jgi:hypothetical protein